MSNTLSGCRMSLRRSFTRIVSKFNAEAADIVTTIVLQDVYHTLMTLARDIDAGKPYTRMM